MARSTWPIRTTTGWTSSTTRGPFSTLTTYDGTPSGGVFQGTIGTSGPGEGQLGGVRGVAIGASGTVWASDYTYYRINSYAPLFPSSLGTPGQYLTQIP